MGHSRASGRVGAGPQWCSGDGLRQLASPIALRIPFPQAQGEPEKPELANPAEGRLERLTAHQAAQVAGGGTVIRPQAGVSSGQRQWSQGLMWVSSKPAALQQELAEAKAESTPAGEPQRRLPGEGEL